MEEMEFYDSPRIYHRSDKYEADKSKTVTTVCSTLNQAIENALRLAGDRDQRSNYPEGIYIGASDYGQSYRGQDTEFYLRKRKDMMSLDFPHCRGWVINGTFTENKQRGG